MKVTFDSNLWERIVHPEVFIKPEERHQDLRAVHRAIEGKRITAFLCQSVATMEAIKKSERVKFFSQQRLRPRVVQAEEALPPMVLYAPDQSARPPLMPVLRDRLSDAIALGFRLIRLPVYVEQELPSDYFIEEPDGFSERYGAIRQALDQRDVGRAQFEALGRSLAARHMINESFGIGALPNLDSFTPAETEQVIKAIAEAADGDAVCAHVALENEFFCSEDFGKSTAMQSVLDPASRKWLSETHGVNFVTLRELAAMLR